MKPDNTTTDPKEPRPASVPDIGTRFLRGKIDRNVAILELAASFPVLRSSVENWSPRKWNIDVFMANVDAICSGARHAKLFVASVWDPSWPTEHGMEFRVVEAMAVWDREHKMAFFQWCADPFWP